MAFTQSDKIVGRISNETCRVIGGGVRGYDIHYNIKQISLS